MIKIIIGLLAIVFSTISFGATCTTTTRNNYSTNQVLTSSALNADFNQLVTKANAFDGGCVTAGSLEYDALNTTQFSPMLKGIKEGCKVTYSNASTLSVGRCLASVNGNFVYTTSPATVSFGCTSCSGESSSTSYYVYIATGSSATTLNLLILTTAPNEDGYDSNGNRVIAKFYNNSSSDIDQYSIDQWVGNQFIPQETGWFSCTMTVQAVTTNPTKGTIARDELRCRRQGDTLVMDWQYKQTAAGSAGSGDYLFIIPNSWVVDTTKKSVSLASGDVAPVVSRFCAWDNTADTNVLCRFVLNSSTQLKMYSQATISTTSVVGSGGGFGSTNFQVTTTIEVPILGW